VLTQGAWQSADLATLIREQLLIGGGPDSRLLLSGPPIVLDAQAALILALILHELGTNARKHGALTVPHGQVALRWETDDRCAPQTLRLTWQEANGPKVAVPSRRGFGSQLIEHNLSVIGGSAVIHFEPAGLRCEISAPLRQLQYTENVASWQSPSVFS
jgi:two-component sensor histidine kinase